MGRERRAVRWLGWLALLTTAGAAAQAPEDDAESGIEVVEVVAPSTLADADDATANMQAATARDIEQARSLDLADFMRRNLSGVFVNEAQGNPLQSDVQYRGFVGSPLLGLPQGLAVYQDAVRINEPFGDVVNWALIPEAAIDTVFLVPGANPLFGLNALGGALSLRTKDGFSHPGAKAKFSAGSFGRWQVSAEAGGARNDTLSYFATASTLQEDGWRDYSPTRANRAFAKLGWRNERTSVDLSATAAGTALIGNGAAPVELLAIERTAIFTRPDRTENALGLFNLVVRHDFSEQFTLNGNIYLRDSDIDSYNGDDSDFENCEADIGYLCHGDDEDEGVPALNGNGKPIPADERVISATINRTQTAQRGVGGSLAAQRLAVADHWQNRLLAGVAVDSADIDFAASTELGALDQTRLAIPGGVFVGDAFTELLAENETASLYVANIWRWRQGLRVSVSGRYNRARVRLRDQLGTALDGDHRFGKVNPALGVSYRTRLGPTVYASYSQSNRVPSPVELTCADEDAPCRLPNAFLADPPLRQVVARTTEAGARGKLGLVDWRAGWFATGNDDDILFVSAGARTNEGYFDNVGRTERRGVEFALSGASQRLRWFVNYTHLSATFAEPFSVPSANHPSATAGEIHVLPGARLPLVPERLLKAGVSATPRDRLRLHGDLLHASRHHLRGDEANLAPSIGGYTVINLGAEYRFSPRFTLFATVDNVLDKRYATFGAFGEADEVLGDDFEDARFVTPAAPRAGWLGIEVGL